MSAQTSGQIPTNLSSGGSSFGGNAAQIQGLLGNINEAQRKRTFEKDDFKGSPYTADIFLPTTLFYGDERMGDLFYRYNALNEEIEIKINNLPDEPIQGLARDKKIRVMVGDYPLSFKTFIDKTGKTMNGYLLTLVDNGDYKLYRRTRVKYTEGMKAQNSFVKAVPSKFTQFTEYFLQVEGIDRIDEIRNKNNALLGRVKNDDKAALKAFLKEKNLNVKNEEEFIIAVQHLNLN